MSKSYDELLADIRDSYVQIGKQRPGVWIREGASSRFVSREQYDKEQAEKLRRMNMGEHLVDGTFQSDKYPTCPAGKVPLSVKDPTAQDLLWEYAQRRRKVDNSFSDDLEQALKNAGYDPTGDEHG